MPPPHTAASVWLWTRGMYPDTADLLTPNATETSSSSSSSQTFKSYKIKACLIERVDDIGRDKQCASSTQQNKLNAQYTQRCVRVVQSLADLALWPSPKCDDLLGIVNTTGNNLVKDQKYIIIIREKLSSSSSSPSKQTVVPCRASWVWRRPWTRPSQPDGLCNGVTTSTA